MATERQISRISVTLEVIQQANMDGTEYTPMSDGDLKTLLMKAISKNDWGATFSDLYKMIPENTFVNVEGGTLNE